MSHQQLKETAKPAGNGDGNLIQEGTEMIQMEVTVHPMGTCSPSMSDWVAKVVKVAKASGLNYQLGPMSTTVEARDLDTLFGVAKQMHEACLKEGVERAITTITIDDRRDKDLTMDYKVKSVMAKVGG